MNLQMSYNKLWKLLIDRNMKKSDLRIVAGISSSSIAKLGKGENVTTDVLLRICKALECGISDIMEVIPEPDKSGGITGRGIPSSKIIWNDEETTCLR